MRLLFLGTAGAQPTASRGLSCTCIERDGEILMFDAGEGAQTAYARAKLGWNKPMSIIITHMHGDHCIGVLGMLQTMSMQGRTEPLQILGPAGIQEFVSANIRMLRFAPRFPIAMEAVSPGVVIDNDGYQVLACGASHTITAFAYVVREKSRPGRFSVKNAQKLGVPEGPLWGDLQRGQDVVVDGRTIRSGQVLGPERAGATVGISGDTAPSSELEKFFAGCDYLVFDATFLDAEAQRAAETRHSTAAQAAELAKSAGAKNLVLTHFSARYKDDAAHLEEARRIHPSVTAAYDMLEILIT